MNNKSETESLIIRKVASKKVVLLDVLSRLPVKEQMKWKEGKRSLKSLIR